MMVQVWMSVIFFIIFGVGCKYVIFLYEYVVDVWTFYELLRPLKIQNAPQLTIVKCVKSNMCPVYCCFSNFFSVYFLVTTTNNSTSNSSSNINNVSKQILLLLLLFVARNDDEKNIDNNNYDHDYDDDIAAVVAAKYVYGVLR